jgi:hypothetical protein
MVASSLGELGRERGLATLILLLTLPVVVSCGDDGGGPQLPNPASVFCEEQGGHVDIERDQAGNERGVCVFDDGSRVDEWQYYREQHEGQGRATDRYRPRTSLHPSAETSNGRPRMSSPMAWGHGWCVRALWSITSGVASDSSRAGPELWRLRSFASSGGRRHSISTRSEPVDLARSRARVRCLAADQVASRMTLSPTASRSLARRSISS